MAVVDEEKQAAIYELKSKYDTNNAKLKQVCFSSFFLIPTTIIFPRPPANSPKYSPTLLFTPILLQLESQKRQNEINLRRAAFTASHLDELPDNVATYHSIGKAYVVLIQSSLLDCYSMVFFYYFKIQ